MSNEYKDFTNELTSEQKYNMELIIKYPILIIHDEWFHDIYSYNETWLDDIPTGWRKAFGLQWAEDVQKVVDNYYRKLKEENQAVSEFDDIYILQLKEKYGTFTQYFSQYTPELREIIKKYQDLSKHICIECGKPAIYHTTDCIIPYCEDCIHKQKQNYEKI